MTDAASDIVALPSIESALSALAALRSEVTEAPTLSALDAVARRLVASAAGADQMRIVQSGSERKDLLAA